MIFDALASTLARQKHIYKVEKRELKKLERLLDKVDRLKTDIQVSKDFARMIKVDE